MNDPELERLCSREGLDFQEALKVRTMVKRNLLPPPPAGVSLKPEDLGNVMEAIAALTSVLWEGPPTGGELWAVGIDVTNYLREKNGLNPVEPVPDWDES